MREKHFDAFLESFSQDDAGGVGIDVGEKQGMSTPSKCEMCGAEYTLGKPNKQYAYVLWIQERCWDAQDSTFDILGVYSDYADAFRAQTEAIAKAGAGVDVIIMDRPLPKHKLLQ